MSEEDEEIAQLKKAISNAESQLAYYRKRYGAIGAPPSVTPYVKLATIYRKQRNYQAEVEVLERFVKRITTEDGHIQTFQQSTRNMLTRLEKARQLSKQKPEGTCEGCGKSPRQLTQIESGQWVCVTCIREIRGQQCPEHLATPEQVNSSATHEELENLQCKNYVNHRSVTVAGVSYDNRDGTSRQQIISRCSAGELLRLTPEDDNPVDANAVAVFRLNGEQLGYLPREDAAKVREGSNEGWLYAAIVNKILDDGVKGHCLGVGLTLVYAREGADQATVKKHIADLIGKYQGSH